MRRTKLYANVLWESSHGKSKEEIAQIAKRLKDFLKRQGELRLISAVLREAKTLQQGKPGLVISASPLSSGMRAKFAHLLFRQNYRMEERVDKEVIGGAAVFLGNEYLIDNTIRGRMQKLWKKVSSTTL